MRDSREFGYKVGAVRDELGVEAERVADGSVDLFGRVVRGLEGADALLDELVESGDVGFGGLADFGFACGLQSYGKCVLTPDGRHFVGFWTLRVFRGLGVGLRR